MHAIAALEYKPVTDPSALVDLEVPAPSPGPHDLLVRVEAVAVNPVDWKQRRTVKPGDAPRILGFDAAGMVDAVGAEVSGFEVGDRVWYSGVYSRPGSNADLQAVDHRIVGHAPRSLSFADAAALPLTALTAWEALRDHFGLIGGGDRAGSGGTLVMIGGAGGVGSIAIQLAKALTPLTVIATASRPETRAWVMDMGADAVADHHDLVATVRRAAPHGVDYIFSTHTPGQVAAYADLIRPFGRIVAIDGGEESIHPLRQKSVSWHYELMFTRPLFGAPDMHVQGDFLTELARMVDAGTITSTATMRLDGLTAANVLEGHRIVESGSAIGKVVIARD